MKKIEGIAKGRLLAVLFFALFAAPLAIAQSGLELEQVSGKVWMVSGGGYANVSLLAGEGKALLVDSKRAAHGEEIRAMARELSGGDVAYLINGHVHPDHTEGNEGFGQAGAIIIAHEEVRRVLMAGQRGGPPAPEAALPVLTIPDNEELVLYFDEEAVRVRHMPAAHSPGNVMVIYEQANVIHMGDLYSPERYPVMAGGSIDGFIAANEAALSEADANTRFIAGNGVVTGPEDVRAYLAMVNTVKNRVAGLIRQGKSLEEVLSAAPTSEFDGTWGDPGRFLPALYNELSDR